MKKFIIMLLVGKHGSTFFLAERDGVKYSPSKDYSNVLPAGRIWSERINSGKENLEILYTTFTITVVDK